MNKNKAIAIVFFLVGVATIATFTMKKSTVVHVVEVTYYDEAVDTVTLSRTGRDLRTVGPWLSSHGCLAHYNKYTLCYVKKYRVLSATRNGKSIN